MAVLKARLSFLTANFKCEGILGIPVKQNIKRYGWKNQVSLLDKIRTKKYLIKSSFMLPIPLCYEKAKCDTFSQVLDIFLKCACEYIITNHV